MVRAALSVAVALALLLFALPRLTGAQWSDISAVLGRLTAAQVCLLTLVWAVGLLGYTWVLTGGLPGLTHAQALVLNLSGSSVSNLVPFGGALGVAVSYAMARSWGFGASSFALMAMVSGIWNVMAKLALPVLALFALLVAGEAGGGAVALGAGAAAVALALGVAGVAGALSSEWAAVQVGRVADMVVTSVRRLLRRPGIAAGPDAGTPGRVLVLRHRTVGLVRRRWHHLTFGIVAFLGAQAVLQWLCLRMVGSALSSVQVFAGFAFGRMLTALVVTPGGVGISETGVAGLLVNVFGGDPAVTASGVLLFSGYAYFLEIWAGGAGYALWVLRRSWRRPPGGGLPAPSGSPPEAWPGPSAGRIGE